MLHNNAREREERMWICEEVRDAIYVPDGEGSAWVVPDGREDLANRRFDARNRPNL